MKSVSLCKKISAFVLVAVIVLGIAQAGVSALNKPNKLSGCKKVTCEVKFFSEKESFQKDKFAYRYSAPVYYSETAGESKLSDYCYERLDERQKSIYDKILAGYEKLDNDYFFVAKCTEDELYDVINDIKIVYVCIADDHPEIFWLGNEFGIGGIDNEDGTYDICTIFEYVVADKTELAAKRKALSEKVDSIVKQTAGMTDFEKEVFFHDYLCNNLVYDFDDWACFTSYGALINGLCVCEGYAESMKMLCNACGIECLLVRGQSTDKEDHMWNMVKLPTGWYELDVTWDDNYTPGTVVYNFFNLNDTEMNKTHIKSNNYVYETLPEDLGTELDFNYYLPSTTHTAGNGGMLRGNIVAFGDAAKPTEIQVIIKASNTVLTKTAVTGNKTSYKFPKLPAGEYIIKVTKENHAPLITTAEFTNGSWQMNFSIRLYGDITGDGLADKKDYNLLKKHINQKSVLEDYSVAIFDFNNDGFADKKDANKMRKHISGKEKLW